MRVNTRVFAERADLMGNIQIPNCPNELRVVAERLIGMVIALDYYVGDYNSVTELDKKLTVDYWRKYHNLETHIGSWEYFKEWYLDATEPDLISRSRRWLVDHNYLIIKEEVRERAQKAARNFSQSFGKK